jgi:hypothetical protein
LCDCIFDPANVHRLAGIYFGCGLICLWAAITARQQRTLVFLIGFAVILAGSVRLLFMSIVGLPEPPAPWLGYLVPELLVSCFMMIARAMIIRCRTGKTPRGPSPAVTLKGRPHHRRANTP